MPFPDIYFDGFPYSTTIKNYNDAVEYGTENKGHMTQETGSRTYGMLHRILDGMLMTCSCSRSCQGISHNLINDKLHKVLQEMLSVEKAIG